MEDREQKMRKLSEYLAGLGSVAVAFSGGVDSTFLLQAAKDVLGDGVIALTAVSDFFPDRERREADAFCRERGIRQIICREEILKVPGVAENPANRCYLCKRALFEMFLAQAKRQGFSHVAEGSNLDDLGDYRPGLQAIAELGILSPLRECGFSKGRYPCPVEGDGASHSFQIHPMPVWRPALPTGRRLPARSWPWSIRRNSSCWIWALPRCGCAFTERWRGLRFCQRIFRGWRNRRCEGRLRRN